jgi:hypothetical protein
VEQYATDFNVMRFDDARASVDLAPIAQWVEQVLCAPHRAANRADSAILQDSFEFIRSNARVETGFVEELLDHLGDFERDGGVGALRRCRLIVPLRLAEPDHVLAAVQQRLKPLFVARRLMLGLFLRDNPAPGAPALPCPLPLVAIRNMVPSDVACLYDDAGYLATCRAWFAERASRAIRPAHSEPGVLAS